ncbi:hypothetical protein [Bdellovibrio sp. GT3]|uniref:hypothetical protein n=1 Tax=Bdellovibrio sp. GT3 TaxID=3136282 RepID=UPI0030F16680
MKTSNAFLFLILGLFSSVSVTHEAPAESNRVGPGKAIEQFDAEQGFKMSEKAMKSLGVSFQSLAGKGPWQISKSALIQIKQSKAVYRRYDGWISMVLVNVVSESKDALVIKAIDLEPGDEIAVQGVSFLRMTDSDLNAGTVDSCAH